MNPSQYKPKSSDDFIGKTKAIADQLFAKIRKIKIKPQPVRWLFYGPPGVGKTALAKLLSVELAENSFAVEEISGQSLVVDMVRHWREQMHYRPMLGKVGVKLINELDLASVPAQNEMLQFLDDLPDYWSVIATTNSQLESLQSRLQSRFKVHRFEAVKCVELAFWLSNVWGIPDAEARAIAAAGDVRQALNDTEAYLEAKEAA
jgi:replication-associated recombination protein RarA